MFLKKTAMNGLAVLSLTLLVSSAGWSALDPVEVGQPTSKLQTSLLGDASLLGIGAPQAKKKAAAPKKKAATRLLTESDLNLVFANTYKASRQDSGVLLRLAAFGYSPKPEYFMRRTVHDFQQRPLQLNTVVTDLACLLLDSEEFRKKIGMSSKAQAFGYTQLLMSQQVGEMVGVSRQLSQAASIAKEITSEKLQAQRKIVEKLRRDVQGLQQEAKDYKLSEAEAKLFEQRVKLTKEHAEVKNKIRILKKDKQELLEKRRKWKGTVDEKAKFEVEFKRRNEELVTAGKESIKLRKTIRMGLTAIHLQIKDTSQVRFSAQKNALNKAEADLKKQTFKFEQKNGKGAQKVVAPVVEAKTVELLRVAAPGPSGTTTSPETASR